MPPAASTILVSTTRSRAGKFVALISRPARGLSLCGPKSTYDDAAVDSQSAAITLAAAAAAGPCASDMHARALLCWLVPSNSQRSAPLPRSHSALPRCLNHHAACVSRTKSQVPACLCFLLGTLLDPLVCDHRDCILQSSPGLLHRRPDSPCVLSECVQCIS